MEKEPGCPFNNFGPCREERCRFYNRSDDGCLECAITATASHVGLVLSSVELTLTIANAAGHALGVTGCRLPMGPEYETMLLVADVLEQLESLPFVSAESRNRLVQGRDDIRKVVEALYHPDEKDDHDLSYDANPSHSRLARSRKESQKIREILFPHSKKR